MDTPTSDFVHACSLAELKARGRLVLHGRHSPQHGVSAFRDTTVIVDLSRLMPLRGQADVRADGPGMDEAMGLIN